jgi:hypothetical protein
MQLLQVTANGLSTTWNISIVKLESNQYDNFFNLGGAALDIAEGVFVISHVKFSLFRYPLQVMTAPVHR